MIETNQLTPDQISSRWQQLKIGFETGLPVLKTGGEARMLRIFNLAINNQIQIWETCIDNKAQVFAITHVLIDMITDSRNLFIYSMFAMGGTTNLMWEEGMHVIKKFAKANNCLSVMALTKNAKVIEIVKRLNGDISDTLVYLEVK